MSLKDKIDESNLPKHVAIIMDGNGRWAKQRGSERLLGHHNGVDSVDLVVEACVELGIKHLTLYAFSTENWNRPHDEIEGLMNLLISTLEKKTESLNKNNVRLNYIGDLASLPINVKNKINESSKTTSGNTALILTVALSYSSRWEILNAVKAIATDVAEKKINIEDISHDTINQHLATYNLPDPELLIRTSGEFRISNFLLYQIAYAELYFTETLWPDFNKEDFFEAIIDYQKRERRFGKTGDQLSK